MNVAVVIAGIGDVSNRHDMERRPDEVVPLRDGVAPDDVVPPRDGVAPDDVVPPRDGAAPDEIVAPHPQVLGAIRELFPGSICENQMIR
jgi:hypothetical protein